MRPSSDHFRDDTLGPALDLAIAGDRALLYDKLRRASGLPAPRVNPGLVRAFASEMARRGAAADGLVAAMLAIHENVAPYGHVDEILPILGAAAAGSRAETDARARAAMLAMLEEASCDRRGRVRDQVAAALVSVGVASAQSQSQPAAKPSRGKGEAVPFVETLLKWVADDQPYLGRAVMTALLDADLLGALGSEGVARLIEAGFDRIEREHRAGRRHDGFRKLLRAFELALPAVVSRFATLADVVSAHAGSADEDARGAIVAAVEAMRRGRLADRAALIGEALEKTKKPSRDPRWDRLPGVRGRGR